jgi:hypothetical protein
MDVTFREWEPYYKTQDDLAQFWEEFSPATKSDCREGENEEHVVVGTIPCPIEQVEEGRSDEDNEGDKVNEQNQERAHGDWEEIVIGTIPCRVEQMEEGQLTEKSATKEIKVYQRRRFGKQGEQPIKSSEKGIDKGQLTQVDVQPQPNEPDASVPTLSSELFPSSSYPNHGTSGNNSSSNLEHIGFTTCNTT